MSTRTYGATSLGEATGWAAREIEMADTAPAVREVKDNRAKLFERAMSRQGYAADALIEVLHTAQELFGFLSINRLREVARKLKLPPYRVLGVATF